MHSSTLTHRSTPSQRQSWRRGAAAAVLALASTGMASATTYYAGIDYYERYFVRVADPVNPFFYSLQIESGGIGGDGGTGPLTNTFAVPQLQLSAGAQTDIGLHKAKTTAIGIARTNAPSVLIPSEGTNPIPIFTQARVSDFDRVLRANSSVTDSFTATTTQSAQANLYAATNLGIRLSLSDAPNNWYGAGGPKLGGISVYSALNYSLYDVTPDAAGVATRQQISQLSVITGLDLRDLSLVNTTVVDVFSNPFYTYSALITSQDTVSRDGVLQNTTVDVPYFPVIDDNGVTFSHSAARNHTVPFQLVAGRRYELTTGFSCTSVLSGLVAFLQGSNGVCDGGNSAYWNGLTQVTDADGNPVQAADVVADSGFNYRWANPLSPSADAVFPTSPVPEPGNWLLLACGLPVLLVLAARRQSRVRAN